MRTLSFILLLLVLCGCSSFPRKMTGQFNARGDFIVIKNDGALYWSPLAKTGDRLTFVGIGMSDKHDERFVRLVAPSSSPFLNSSVTFSADYDQVTVDWGGLTEKAGTDRETVYKRLVKK
jgi:starvation-inducible outer membrane lipoprotein